MRTLALRTAMICLLAPSAWALAAAEPAKVKAQQPAASQDASPEILRLQLEQIYRAVRKSLAGKDYATFMKLVIPAQSGKAPSKAVFDQLAVHLLDDYPDPALLQFVKIDRSGEWTGYYTENRFADPDRTDILLFMFKRSGKDWKMSGRVVVHSIPPATGQARTLNEIALNPKFRLPGQRGYREKQTP